jgi:hypothetical protein
MGGAYLLVEAAGRLFHLFRDGPDYAFIPASRDAGRVIHRMMVGES